MPWLDLVRGLLEVLRPADSVRKVQPLMNWDGMPGGVADRRDGPVASALDRHPAAGLERAGVDRYQLLASLEDGAPLGFDAFGRTLAHAIAVAAQLGEHLVEVQEAHLRSPLGRCILVAETSRGLEFECDLPATSWANDTLELVRS